MSHIQSLSSPSGDVSDWRDLAVAASYLCGLIYFLSWSLSFYPQPVLNFRRKSTTGLTPDFPLLNVLGFASYTIATLELLCSRYIRSQYANRHPSNPEPTVRLNDAAFGVHALIICLVTYSQFWPRLWGWAASERPSRRATPLTHGVIAGALFALLLVQLLVIRDSLADIGYAPVPRPHPERWYDLDMIYCLEYIKLVFTFFKYLPQAIHNYKRKSTEGWAIGGMVLDVIGGVASLVQLVIDSGLQSDWSGLTGNPVKLGLANISLAFDIIFLVQHYILYRVPAKNLEHGHHTERTPLLA